MHVNCLVTFTVHTKILADGDGKLFFTIQLLLLLPDFFSLALTAISTIIRFRRLFIVLPARSLVVALG